MLRSVCSYLRWFRNHPRGIAVSLLVVWGFLFHIPATAQTNGQDQRPEYEVKAAFLYKFTLFTEWPANAFQSKSSPFIIGILGDDPFGREIDKIAQTEKVGDRKIVVTRVEKGGPPPDCQILFICSSERRRVEEILASVKNKPVLTVSEIDPFCSKGGSIRLYQENRKIKLRINPVASKEAGLRIRPELLAIAKIVKTGEQ